MILTLEVVSQQAAKLGAAGRAVFSGKGGTIGRLPDNDWVLPDPYISGKHARIRYANGQFLLEDTSSNGVFLSSPQNRLPRNQSHVLKSGDRFFIDAYEIRATLARAEVAEDPYGMSARPGRSASPLQLPAEDPFADLNLQNLSAGGEADPLKLLGLEPPASPASPVLRAQDLSRASPLSQHYRPPAPIASPPLEEELLPSSAPLIPDDYDPLASGEVFSTARTSTPPPLPLPPSAPAVRPTPSIVAPRKSPVPPVVPRPLPVAPATPAQLSVESPPPASDSLDFAALLAAAGIDGVKVTPELARSFGQILRVVVSGLMDVLRARERIKDEFRMHMTTFKAADNNPLKFSANVDDALHNLLVKRNAAYLAPVEAFEDAFTDVRNHQMAMLAGLRVAFESMLSEFEPDQLQEQFDRQLKKGSFLSGPAKLRYWDLYRDRFHDMVKDADANFRELFGDEFAKAYEEQLQRLKIQRRSEER